MRFVDHDQIERAPVEKFEIDPVGQAPRPRQIGVKKNFVAQLVRRDRVVDVVAFERRPVLRKLFRTKD